MERSGSRSLNVLALQALAAGLLVAGVVAVVAVLGGSFDRTDGRLIATSIGFGVFSVGAAAGGARLADRRLALRLVGWAAIAASALAFVLLLAAVWLPDPADAVWRAFGMTGLVALWASHAGVMLSATRDDDTPTVTGLTFVAVAALSLDAIAGVATLAGFFDDLRAPELRQVFAAILIVAVVTSVLVPILRRLSGPAARPAPTAPRPTPAAAAAAWPVHEPRRGLGLDRLGPGVWIVAPALVVAVFALGWIAHRPRPTAILRGVTSVVTVTTPATPTTVPQEGFTAKDGERIIRRRRDGFDASAKARVGTLASMVEVCFARTEDFTACDTAAEVPDAGRAGLVWGMADDQVAVTASAAGTYSITARSRTGGAFTVSRDQRGREVRTCTPQGTGGCLPDGTW